MARSDERADGQLRVAEQRDDGVAQAALHPGAPEHELVEHQLGRTRAGHEDRQDDDAGQQVPPRNVRVVLEGQRDAALSPVTAGWGEDTGAGRQLLPTTAGPDGLFYALLRKSD